MAVGPAGQLAVAVFAAADPAASPSTAWVAISESGVITRALTFRGDGEVSSTIALAWRRDGALLVAWNEYFDVGWGSHAVVLPP
jgi:hypothetical protein